MSSVVELRRDLSLHFVAGEGVAAQAVPVQLAFTAHPSHPSEVAVFASARAQDGAEARRVLTATARTDTSRRLIGLHSQSTACLHRFGPEDLIYFWADYGTRVDLLAVKVGFEDAFDTSAADSMDAEGHPGEALRRSVPPIQCSNCEVLYSLDVAHHLTATSSSAKVDTNAIRLVKVEVASTTFGADSALFLHFFVNASGATATFAIDAINLLAVAEKKRKGEAGSDIVPISPPLIITSDTRGSSSSSSTVDVAVVKSSISAQRVFCSDVPAGVISIGYTVAVKTNSTSTSSNPSNSTSAITYARMVTLEDRLVQLLSDDASAILNNPDMEITFPLPAPENVSSSTSSASGLKYAVDIHLDIGLLEIAASTTTTTSGRGIAGRRSGAVKLWRLCLDLGMVWLERRIRIDALQDMLLGSAGAVNIDQQQQQGSMSKKSFCRLILLEVLATNGLVHCISDYITAVATSTATEISQKFRGADAASVSSEYVLRDVTRVHQWAVTLLEQLSEFVRDQILRDFVVPFLYAKSSGIASIRDLPVLNMQEINTCIVICQSAVAVFEALIMRKMSELSSLMTTDTSTTTTSTTRTNASSSTSAMVHQHTALLDGQRQVAAALLGSLRVARLACASPSISLPSIAPIVADNDISSNTSSSSASVGLVHVEVDFDRRTTVADFALKLLGIHGYTSNSTSSGASTSSNTTTSRFLTFADRVVSLVSSGGANTQQGAFLDMLLASIRGDSNTTSTINTATSTSSSGTSSKERARMKRYIQSLTDVMFAPVAAAKKHNANTSTNTTSAGTSTANVVAIAYANLLHVLLESFGGIDFTASEVLGFASDFAIACDYSYTTTTTSTSTNSYDVTTTTASVFPRRVASVLASLWLLDYGGPASTPTAVLELIRNGFDLSIISLPSASYSASTYTGALFAPMDVARHAIVRLLVNSQWRPALTIINHILPHGKLRTPSSHSLRLTSDAKCNDLVLFGSLAAGAAMLEVDDWRDAWHYSRSLLDRASTASNGSGSGVRRLVNLFVSRLSADGRLNEFIGGTYPIQDQMVLEAELRTRLSESIATTSNSNNSVTTYASALILFLLHQHRLQDAISTTQSLLGASSNIALPAELVQLVKAAERFPPSIRSATRPVFVPPNTSDAQQEQVAVHDGVSSFENILRQFQEQQQ